MSSVIFDTLKFVDALENVQIPREQARAIVEMVRDSHDAADVATKGDIARLDAKIDAKIDLLRSEVRGDTNLLRWMVGILLAGVTSLVFKAFF